MGVVVRKVVVASLHQLPRHLPRYHAETTPFRATGATAAAAAVLLHHLRHYRAVTSAAVALVPLVAALVAAPVAAPFPLSPHHPTS